MSIRHSPYSILNIFLSCSFFLQLNGFAETQEEPDIRSLLKLVKTGNEQLLQQQLPQLLEQFPNHPGLLYVKGLITSDGDEAVGYYQTIVAESPSSEWADDALFKLYEYYYAIGAYNVAAQQAAELKKRFPSSPYLKQVQNIPAAEKESKEPVKQYFEYSVQAGAFSSAAAAQVQLRDIKSYGYSCELHTKISSSPAGKPGSKIYAVWVGEFNSFDQAAAFAKKMKLRHNIEAIVVRR